MKTPIEARDIRQGDLIRNEAPSKLFTQRAFEYIAQHEGDTGNLTGKGILYLLERPQPPFEPYWGMVIADPNSNGKAAYMPDWERDWNGWAVTYDGSYVEDYGPDEWAKQKLAEGWVVIGNLGA